MKRSQRGSLTVSGPYEDDHAVPTPRCGLAVGSTFATRHRDVSEELTYYVRDIAGELLGRVTKLESGIIELWLTPAGEKVEGR